jgi:hypothetical protein
VGIFDLLLELVVDFVIATIKLLTKIALEIARLARYAGSARYRAEIDEAYRNRRPWEKWLERSQYSVFIRSSLLPRARFCFCARRAPRMKPAKSTARSGRLSNRS